MKLYTENHLKEMYFKGLHNGENHIQGVFFDALDIQTPIELPSDEEIEKSYPYCFQFTDDHHFGNKDCFKEGAKWMKEQILNQNK